MITLFVEESNPLTPNFYNKILNQFQFHRLTCPCGHSSCLSIHGYYNRFIKTPTGKLCFRICRVICNVCGHTHAILLSSMVPYSQISTSNHIAIISNFESATSQANIMNSNPFIDESNYRYILRCYLAYWREKLFSERILLSSFPKLITSCFSFFSRQFMQIKCTPNILFLNTTTKQNSDSLDASNNQSSFSRLIQFQNIFIV